MRGSPPLDELQPPPYQDDSGSPHLSCTPSELGDGKCELPRCCGSPRSPSEGSPGPEASGFHSKGYAEDVPSDSTAVLNPEVGRQDVAEEGSGNRDRARHPLLSCNSLSTPYPGGDGDSSEQT